ncbi:MAG: phosphatase PAP2 family protein [Patescibacteria group bacterium]
MDLAVFNFLNSFAGRWESLDAVAIFFAKYSGYVLLLILAFIFLRNTKKSWRVIAQVAVASLLARGIITEVIRWIWPRLRPFVENNVNLLLSHEANASFPSGHAAFYFALTTIVYFYNKKIGILFFAVSFLMGIARVFVGVHWPSDILAGAFIGIISSWLIVRILKKI